MVVLCTLMEKPTVREILKAKLWQQSILGLLANVERLNILPGGQGYIFNIYNNYIIDFNIFVVALCVYHVIWTECQMLKLVLNIKLFLLLWFLICCETHFGAPSRFRLGYFIVKISVFCPSFNQGVNKKVNKFFDIRHQFQNLMPCPNDMSHTSNTKVGKFLDKIKR